MRGMTNAQIGGGSEIKIGTDSGTTDSAGNIISSLSYDDYLVLSAWKNDAPNTIVVPWIYPYTSTWTFRFITSGDNPLKPLVNTQVTYSYAYIER